ncbi:MAG: Holliday junction branch migration protein RuvA [Alcanivorax sp.]|uniref:Holliday junction branch migration protein RuvA n=1 Tax=unclassified Ketobacter TaxID=2639109 RepID=UPI000C8BCE7F|nr:MULTISPECIES: Holliday junction branch migration protein RuvA [unclassified Ketobacter]MAA60411.1 Holliday junction branch migration protein RuvA [Pseudomonadales bacterium]TNC90031.1 MAG: Holliday junction branch migration protein RuvA [Alcanivorax sp.]HAU12497.1 Holliday junction branch migration protein RuvA [Gammaproteobacteria bacterium]MCK5791660.1 Holliday junction branch migration protein RuvA [Ketobacter sp.]RLT89875.1 MAG: Holliday junction branch migration protein RuvA [Ketobacte|tara:strand:+ start:504 stop:1112 length:609 start_codon:yes stop_codon:yes gene_type:complete
MIGRIKGIIIEKQAPVLLVEVAGVGYEVEAPMTTFYRIPEVGKEVILHTHFVVREDAQLLYGFFEKDERELFRLLIKVNGVGPKMALAILSGMEGSEFVRCVQDHDTHTLVKLPGVGKKTAERLVIEMQDRVKAFTGLAPQPELTPVSNQQRNPRAEINDAESALIALGYKPTEAAKAIAAIDADGLKSEEIIRQALKRMVN